MPTEKELIKKFLIDDDICKRISADQAADQMKRLVKEWEESLSGKKQPQCERADI